MSLDTAANNNTGDEDNHDGLNGGSDGGAGWLTVNRKPLRRSSSKQRNNVNGAGIDDLLVRSLVDHN